MLFHSVHISDIFKDLNSSIEGLTTAKADQIRLKVGPNEIPNTAKQSLLLLFGKQFKSLLIYFLLLAAVISFLFDHRIDTVVILIIVLINATIGFFQEFKAEKAIAALQKIVVQKTKVYRDGKLIELATQDLVHGDIIVVEEGDKIPADARLLEEKNLRLQESALTGESLSVDKVITELPPETAIADQKNMLWLGTTVASGKAKAVVVATGISTQLGQIATNLSEIQKEKSHFEIKTEILTKQMALLAGIGGLTTFLIGYFYRDFEFLEIFMFTIATIVSSVPEGLPAVLVIVLAIGTSRMAKRNAIIRRLTSTETLGVIDFIMTDKTGTLTQNIMQVQTIILPNQDIFTVTGKGYLSEGNFLTDDGQTLIDPLENSDLNFLLHIAGTCNSASIIVSDNHISTLGDPTELATLCLAQKAKLNTDLLKSQTVIDDLPFSSEHKFRATLVKTDSHNQIFTLGAPENLLSLTTHYRLNSVSHKLSEDQKQIFLNTINEFSKQGKRLLALTYKDNLNLTSISYSDCQDLCLIGFVAIYDPPREEVSDALRQAHQAGIKVCMATGDHKETALAIAKQIGLVPQNTTLAYSQLELEALTDHQFKKAVSKCQVFARLTPSMKLKILQTLQALRYTVAMTGDGVNDAPALKQADIGIAMGVSGTDVARESSDMILADDNFSSIVSAIEEGRLVFNNTRQTSTFLITTNFAEIATILTTLIISLPLPLLPLQILWLNLVTDTVASLSLAVEPSHKDLLLEPPRSKKEHILGKETFAFLLIMMVVMATSTILVFIYTLPQGLEKARTAAFLVMAFTQIFNMLNMRSLKRSVFSIGLFSNRYVNLGFLISILLLVMVIYTPFLSRIFQFQSVSLIEFVILMIISSLVFIVAELHKKINYHYGTKITH